MTILLIILFIITLIYFAAFEHMSSYVNLIAIQGFTLFGIGVLELGETDLIRLGFVLVETLMFKAIILPYFLYRIVRRHKLYSVRHRARKGFYSVLMTCLIIIASFAFGYFLHDTHLQIKYFAAALSAILTGLVFIINNKNILAHLVSYLIIENGIFLLALAVGGEMPMLVNSAVLLDIFTSVLVLGIFLNKVGENFQEMDTDFLTNLKD